ncbi:MAG: hypothetical protein ABS95_02530 [Verrucomicrobia bacterium SCN 57-15]|nr:MAG: hypothetical protein ABS95_02530 [Verrucomicrobia bacterium SCN 57-15]
MKTILQIGYKHFLLPSAVNVNAVLQALSKATQMDRDWSESRGEIFRPEKRPDDIAIKIVKDEQVMAPTKPKALPEKASEDANNTF